MTVLREDTLFPLVYRMQHRVQKETQVMVKVRELVLHFPKSPLTPFGNKTLLHLVSDVTPKGHDGRFISPLSLSHRFCDVGITFILAPTCANWRVRPAVLPYIGAYVSAF